MKVNLLSRKVSTLSIHRYSNNIGLSFLLVIIFTFLSGAVFSQNPATAGTIVTGIITSSDSVLAGVTVQVKGSRTTTTTDEKGQFSIRVPANSTLVVTSVGYTSQEIKVGNRSSVSIAMLSSSQQMNEVVVVGYGTQKKGTVTGAVSTIKAEDLMKTPSTTTAGALVGKVQGITFRQTDSRPGNSSNIQIRNMGDPLFVIDGVPSDNGQFNQLGVGDIENISILKDASAAIYGLRAANGVVLVTTKKGRSGSKAAISITGYQGYQNYTRLPKPPDAATYLRGLAWSNQNKGVANPTNITAAELAKWDAGTEKGYESFDYYKEIMRPNVPQSYVQASASGGSANSKYYFSVSHVGQDALIKDFLFQRTNMQANLEAGLAKGLKIGMQISGRYEKRRQTGVPGTDDYFNPFLSVYSMWPTERPYANDNPKYINGAVHSVNVNPATYTYEVTGYTEDDWRAIKPIATVQYDLPFGLTLKGTYAYNYTTQRVEEFEYTYNAYVYDPATSQYNISGGNQNPWRRKRDQTIEDNFAQAQLSYAKTIGDHAISATAAYERTEVKSHYFEIRSLPQNNTVQIIYFQDQNVLDQRYSEVARAGYIGKVNYAYKNKYLLEGLGRYDGSYLYNRGSRFGLFPGISLGWKPLEENFMKNGLGAAFTDLKIRASYGETGSELGADPFAYLVGYNYAAGDAVFNGVRVTGVSPRGLPITTLTWVTNQSKNIGIDFAMFNNKFSGTFDVFDRKRTGLPASRNDVLLPIEVGYGFPNQNLNTDATRGIEGILTYNNTTKSGLNYSISINGTLARAKSLYIYNPRFGNSWDQYRNSTVDRWSSVNFGYHVIGRFQSEQEIDDYKINNDGQGNRTQLPGDLIFEDANGDGIINGLDQRPIGYAQGAQPYLAGGFNSSFSYRGISLQVDFSGASMQTYERQFEAQIPFQNNGAGIGYLISDAWRRADPFDAKSAWIPGTYPAVRKDVPNHVNFSNRNDFWITNVHYVRLRNLEVGYDFPKNFLSRYKVGGLRVYVHGTNLFSIDNMRDFDIDPEIGSTNALQTPQQRIYTFGFNLNL